MKIPLFLFIFFLCSCGQSRVEKLEKDNIALKNKVDSMQVLADIQSKIAREMLNLAKEKGEKLMDSLIIANNLKVIRVNESCGDEEYRELLKAIKGIEQELIEFDIEVVYNDLDDCGYELHHGVRKKRIEGIVKEAELKNEVERFFNIKLNKSHSDQSTKTSTS